LLRLIPRPWRWRFCCSAQKSWSIRNTIATIFEPVSEQGRAGMDELHEQTINLLSFQQMPMAVFDSQVAFNMLDRYGRTSAHPLEATERRIAAHLRRLLGTHAPMPSMMLVQAPVFHAHTFPSTLSWILPWLSAISLAVWRVSMCRLRAHRKILPAT